MGGAGRGGPRGIRDWSTPLRLRASTAALAVLSAGLLAVTVVGVTQIRDSVQTIGDHAAPVTSTASDLYFSLSTMDAQVARLILVGDDESTTSTQFDATRTFQSSVSSADADIRRIAASATDDETRTRLNQILDGITRYQQLAGQATLLVYDDTAFVAGVPNPESESYYFQATDLMHGQLLPLAQDVRDSYVGTLNSTYQSRHTTAVVDEVLAIVVGLLLVAALLICQVWYRRRFRRRLSLALVGALALTIGLTAAVATVLSDEAGKLSTAVNGTFQPYLTLLKAQAVSVDADADTVRYMLNPSLSYGTQFEQESAQLTSTAAGGLLRDPSAAGALTRWSANVRDNASVVSSMRVGDVAGAVDVATGIARNKAGFDFSYYDAALSSVSDARQQAFTAEIGSADSELGGWSVIPEIAVAALLLLLYLAVRPRAAEYR